MDHWITKLAEKVFKKFGEKEIIIGNGGLSVSGLQHVGRLRGEITIVETVLRILEDKGLNVEQKLTLYTMDAWKGKKQQLDQFSDYSEAKNYIGWPLYMVPDPLGCHNNWVEHYWEDFGPYLGRFTDNIEVITTKDLYENNIKMKKFVIKSITEKRDKIIEIINKYRGEKKLPKNYIPFQPICNSCGRIDTTTTLEVDVTNMKAKYLCHNCGYNGWQKLEKGKLNWRLEWVGVWYSLNVTFEPYGKDHATPGGSRDSCSELAIKVFNFEPPEGTPYEWVGYRLRGRDVGDMGSSDFIGFSPREWLEVAEAEALRYLYLITPPMRRIVLSLEEVPRYEDMLDKAERVYYGIESIENEEIVKKSYELALLSKPPSRMPFQLPYLHAVILVQILPSKGEDIEEAIKRLKETRYMKYEPSDIDIDRIEKRLRLARRWLEKYAPERYRIQVVDNPPLKKISVKKGTLAVLKQLYNKLRTVDWEEAKIKEAMISIERTREEEREMFRALYLAFFGKPYGPRIAPYLAMLNKDFVLNRIKMIVDYLEKVI